MSTENECELSKILGGHLEKLQIEEAVATLKNEKYRDTVEKKSWDLIPVIAKHLKDDVSKNSDLIQCCGELLSIISQYALPEEAMLEFVEQAHCPDNDTLFLALLDPLINVHMRLTRRRGDSLKWVLDAILSHILRLSTPEMSAYEGDEERKLLDLDEDVVRINSLYSAIISSLKPLIEEISLGATNDMESLNEMTSTIVVFMIRLLGGPISKLDLSYDGKFKSSARANSEKLMYYIASLSADMMHYLENFDDAPFKKKGSKINETIEGSSECDSFSFESIPDICFSVFYYMLVSGKVEYDKIPCVYSHLYIFQCCMYLSTIMFDSYDNILLLKGLSLAKSVVEMQTDSSVSHEVLDSPVHSTFQKSIINAIVYNSSHECRAVGVKVLELYLKKFDEKGKYLVLSSLLASAGHAGLAGFLLVQLKDIINVTVFKLQNDEKAVKPSGFFTGQNLLALLISPGGCTLGRGAETDILEASDQILSALNLLRFLAIRDLDNISGFWDHVSTLRKRFLMPLREGLDMSRAHYEVKLKELEEEKRSGRRKIGEKSDVNVKIAGMDLPHLTLDKKILVVESALSTFDLIESVLGRLNECLELTLRK